MMLLCKCWCLRIRFCLSVMLFMISIYSPLTLTRCRTCSHPVSPGPNGNASLLFLSRGCRRNTKQQLTNQSCNPSEQTVDFIIFLISSSFIWIICWLLSFLPALSSWCGKTHQESISRPGPCVSQSKSGASSSSPSLQAELFTTHWCGGWPAVLLVNYSYPLSS